MRHNIGHSTVHIIWRFSRESAQCALALAWYRCSQRTFAEDSACSAERVLHFFDLNFAWPKTRQIAGEHMATGFIISSYLVQGRRNGWAGWPIAHPDFGKSVNTISTIGGRLCPAYYYLPTQLQVASYVTAVITLFPMSLKFEVPNFVGRFLRRRCYHRNFSPGFSLYELKKVIPFHFSMIFVLLF